MMSSNTLGSNDFNPINRVVQTSVRKATLQKDDKPQLTNNPTDTFERTTQAVLSQPKPTEKSSSIAPWVLAGASLLVSLGTLGLVATQFFKRHEGVPPNLTDASLKPLLDRLEALEASIANVSKGVELKDVETLINTLKQDILAVQDQKAKAVQFQLSERITALETQFNKTVGEIKSRLEGLEGNDVILSIDENTVVVHGKPPVGKPSLNNPEVSHHREPKIQLLEDNGTLILESPYNTNPQVKQFLDSGGEVSLYIHPDNEADIETLMTAKLDYLQNSITNHPDFEGLCKALILGVNRADEKSEKFDKTTKLISDFILAENVAVIHSIIESSTATKRLFQDLQKNHPELIAKLQAVLNAKGEDLPTFRTAFGKLVTELETIFLEKPAKVSSPLPLPKLNPPAVVSRLLKSAKINPIEYIVPEPVNQKIQSLMDKYAVAPSGVYLNGGELASASTELVDHYQPKFTTDLSYEDWVDTLKHAKELHMGDEHGHIFKPVLTLFASGAARFKDDAEGNQFERFTQLMETIMIKPECGLDYITEWNTLLANLEVDANAPLVNFGHDALADRNFNDLYSIPFYNKLIELSKPSADAEPKFQFHLSNHGLAPLIDFLHTVVVNERKKISNDRFVYDLKVDTRIDPDPKLKQMPSFSLAYNQLEPDKAMEHLIKPYLELMKQACLLTFNTESNHLTIHAPLTAEFEKSLKDYMGYTVNWEKPQAVASYLNDRFRKLIGTLQNAIETNNYQDIGKEFYRDIDTYSKLTFMRPKTGSELVVLPNNVQVIHGHNTPNNQEMQALNTTAAQAHQINLDNELIKSFAEIAKRVKQNAHDLGCLDISEEQWLNNTSKIDSVPSISEYFDKTQKASPLPIAIY
jgi:hypothetical protein